ncbi:MAG: ACT domain-containing protein [Dehalococcoidia bacterium]|nr:ACT domain-containing protein [Dehalococcoidia bacterium]
MTSKRNSAVEGIVPGGGYTATVRAEYPNKPGMLGRVASTIGEAGGDISSIDLVSANRDVMVRDITVGATDSAHARKIIDALKAIPGLNVRSASDRVFLAHLGGKIEIHNRLPLATRRDLSTVYTPGVARVSNAIHLDPEVAWTLTTKRNAVAIVTDGSAVLGLGDIGPAAALPVMEGKAMLFKEFADVDAWPLCLDTKDPDEIVRIVKAIAPGFGGINLEDISAPRCFEIEQRLKHELDIAVFHDDQHGTAVVVLAALLNALRIVEKPIDAIKVTICGVGAAGTAIAGVLRAAGVQNIVGVDVNGIVYPGRPEGMNPALERFASEMNPGGRPGTIHDAIAGADVFIGVSAPRLITADDVRKMNSDAIVFALANPDPEIQPEELEGVARIIATGRSDYPNQINNVLCFPGLFRGVLDVRASDINEAMKVAAAHAIAGIVGKNELSEEYIIPSVFNRNVARAVAREVSDAARSTGVARRTRRRPAVFL